MNMVFNAYAAYYDLLYQDKNYHKEAQYIYRFLEENGISSGKILELGSGTGKHAEEFAKMGFCVHGIDLSQKMVQEANHRNNNNQKGQLFFEVGDVRNFEAGKKFDAVISLFHVISYQTKNEDIQKMFKTAAKHLKQNGVFIFDFWYGPGVLTDPPAVRQKHLENKDSICLKVFCGCFKHFQNIFVFYLITNHMKKGNNCIKLFSGFEISDISYFKEQLTF